ncbi:hypothetical protein PHMEG_00024388, partial [Phytophthora megakarya]
MAHVVVFADLSPRAKVQYTRFLIDHNVKVERQFAPVSIGSLCCLQFHQRPSDKQFAANIRLLQPSATDNDHHDNSDKIILEGKCVDAVDPIVKRLAAVPEGLRAYENLILLVFFGGRFIGERPTRSSTDPATYVKETRLVRFINEVYDARYEELSASCMNSCESFAKFIRHYLTTRFGLKCLVDQQAWDLIEGLDALQHGKYPERTLSFFLLARSSLQ